MAEKMSTTLLQNDQTFKSLHLALDPKSLLQSQLFDSNKTYEVRRGPRYKQYSDLRDKWLRIKNCAVGCPPANESPENRPVLAPQKKQVKFSCSAATPPKRPNNRATASPSSVVAQSVPDFTSFLRKENRKPTASSPSNRPSVTPPAMKSGRMYGKMVGGGGSKSAVASDEKRSGGGAAVMSRKSYANIDELKGLARAAGNAIVNGGNTNKSVRKSAVFRFRQL